MNKTIDRKKFLKFVSKINIYYKKDAFVTIDANMYHKSGKNLKPQIINVSVINDNDTLKNLIIKAKQKAQKMYTQNDKRYTLIHNKDTNTFFEIGNQGIGKTLSKNVPIEKVPTISKLKELGEQAIYYRTSFDKDKHDIKYHHFLTPILICGNKRKAVVRIVIKEYTNRTDLNNKFYYHQIEYF